MRTLYIDCGMGAAGDMLTAALAELTGDVRGAVAELNALGLPGIRYVAEPSEKCGITGTHIRVLVDGREEDVTDHPHGHDHGEHEHPHEHGHGEHEHPHGHSHGEHEHPHSHHSLADIEHIVREHLRASEHVKTKALEVYRILAEAEGAVHGRPVPEIHFHEVGTMDAVADVTAVCYLMERLGVERIVASPVHVGRGRVKCAHGILPVPAPATARILSGIPIYSLPEVEGELCTPTGAALLRCFAQEFRAMPEMKVDAIGYGMGKKDFSIANCVRVFLGEAAEVSEKVWELQFNVDDMTGEEIGYAAEKLLASGAWEVFTTAVGMKKGRPGILVTVLSSAENRERLVGLIFRHTTTLGIRETENGRYMLDRTISEEKTSLGTIRRKDASGYGTRRYKYEYEDLKAIADQRGCSIREILDEIR